MTIANFKTLVAAYLKRQVSDFSVGGQDVLLLAMNDARRDAQLAHEFELLRTEDAYLSTHLGGADWTNGCKTTPGGGTTVLLKRVDEVWNYGTTAVGSTTYYPRTTRIPFGYTGDFRRQLPPVDRILVTNQVQQNFSTQIQFAYTNGTNLFVTTVAQPTIFKLVGIRYLDDLTGSETPDIFLTFFVNWFKLATIAALNVYLSAADRFQIDQKLMDDAWQKVKFFDGSVANMGEAAGLD